MKNDLFQSCGHCWVFQIWWHIECNTFTASSFRIWNSSTGILPPPLAFFIMMLPNALLTSHSRMSGSRWVITPSWLSGLWRSFLYSSSVYSCHLFTKGSARVVIYCSLFNWSVVSDSWTASRKASLSFTISQNLLKLMSIQLVVPSNHLILCLPVSTNQPSIFPSIRVFFQLVGSLHQVAKVLELRHQSFPRIFSVDFL